MKFCSRCRWHKYYPELYKTVFSKNTWYYEWAEDLESKHGGKHITTHNGCLGCARVTIRHAQVLAILLWKLGIEVKV